MRLSGVQILVLVYKWLENVLDNGLSAAISPDFIIIVSPGHFFGSPKFCGQAAFHGYNLQDRQHRQIWREQASEERLLQAMMNFQARTMSSQPPKMAQQRINKYPHFPFLPFLVSSPKLQVRKG
jgi:hypothetical protein